MVLVRIRWDSGENDVSIGKLGLLEAFFLFWTWHCSFSLQFATEILCWQKKTFLFHELSESGNKIWHDFSPWQCEKKEIWTDLFRFSHFRESVKVEVAEKSQKVLKILLQSKYIYGVYFLMPALIFLSHCDEQPCQISFPNSQNPWCKVTKPKYFPFAPGTKSSLPGYLTPDVPPMPRLEETKARRPHNVLCQRASQDRFRERWDDRTQTKDIVRGLRGTHGRRAPAEEGDVWGNARG